MRETKFRGFGVWADCKSWYYGDLLHYVDGKVEIVVEKNSVRSFNYEVDPKSVGEFTGLKDRQGKEIYEGDIVAFSETVMSDVGEDKPDYIEKRIVPNFEYADGTVGERRYGRQIKIVRFEEKSCGFEPFSDSEKNCHHCGGGDSPKVCEAIGNIWENPELLKRKEKNESIGIYPQSWRQDKNQRRLSEDMRMV